MEKVMKLLMLLILEALVIVSSQVFSVNVVQDKCFFFVTHEKIFSIFSTHHLCTTYIKYITVFKLTCDNFFSIRRVHEDNSQVNIEIQYRELFLSWSGFEY